MNKLVLGLDMGTTSISAVALDERGRVAQAVTKTHNAAVDGLPPDYAEQSPERIQSAAMSALADLCLHCSVGQIVGIGLTGQMHSTVLLDSARAVVGNVITWQDRRSLSPCSDGSTKGTLLSELQHRATDTAMLRTGCRLSPGYLGTTLFSMRRLGQLKQAVKSVSFVADWIGSCLTGQSPVTDRSHAASSGLYDFESDDWSDMLLQAAEIPHEWLPPVKESTSEIGTLSAAVAHRLGISNSVPVFNAIGDNQASVLSALPDAPGSILINIGTGGQIVWRVPSFVRQLPLDTRVLPGGPSRSDHPSKPQFMIVGAGLCGGDAIAWVNRTVRRWLSDFGFSISEDDVWKTLGEKVHPSSDADNLICEPFFRGTRYEPDRRGVLNGLYTENLTPSNLLVAVLNGIAQSMFDVWRTSPSSHEFPLRQVAMSGNAVKHNPILVEAVRRRFDVPVHVARHSEEAATGAAMVAGVGLGIWDTYETARRLVAEASVNA